MKKLCRNSAIIEMASRAVALCVGGSLLGLIALAPYSHAQAVRSDSQEKSRVLTFAERVAYQYAIEEIYWRHRIWPKENPKPKPSLDEVMSRAQIEKKVKDYLRNSQRLADQWQHLHHGRDGRPGRPVGAPGGRALPKEGMFLVLAFQKIVGEGVQCSTLRAEDRQCVVCFPGETFRFGARFRQSNDGWIGGFLRGDIFAGALAQLF